MLEIEFQYKTFGKIQKSLGNKITIKFRDYSYYYFDILIFSMGGEVCVEKETDTDSNCQRDKNREIWDHNAYSFIVSINAYTLYSIKFP